MLVDADRMECNSRLAVPVIEMCAVLYRADRSTTQFSVCQSALRQSYLLSKVKCKALE
jgi:hypothetical protein